MKSMIWYMASRNLMRRLKFFITVVICVIFTCFSFVLTMSILDMTISGINLSHERQGADVLVYPKVSELNDTSMLYSGVAQSVYMDASIMEELNNDKVEAVTPQFYLHTLPSSGCCEVSKEYRLVGIDWETDFIVKPWMKNKGVTSLGKGQIIVGAALENEINPKTMILNNMEEVVSILEPTGTSLDHSLFFDVDQLRRIGKLNFLPSTFDDKETKDVVTCVMIKLKDGVSAEEYIAEFDDVNAKFISTSSTEEGLKQTIDTFAVIFTAVITIILLLCCVTLISQFRLLTISRCKEVGYLRSIGMSRSKVNKLFLVEFGLIGLIGGLMGSLLGILSAGPFIEWISQKVAFPITEFSGMFMLKHYALGIGVSVIICMISTVSSLRYITRISPHDAITKGEI